MKYILVLLLSFSLVGCVVPLQDRATQDAVLDIELGMSKSQVEQKLDYLRPSGSSSSIYDVYHRIASDSSNILLDHVYLFAFDKNDRLAAMIETSEMYKTFDSVDEWAASLGK